jgi:hypothetical protein
VTFGVIDTQAAKRHSHRLTVKHFATQVTLPPAGDPATAGVIGARVGCPRGYKATGGGFDASQFSVVPFADLFPGSYEVIAVNQTNQAGTLEVTAGCVKTRSRRARTSDAGAGNFRARVERYRQQVRAAR